MPNIETYENRINGLQPNNAGYEAYEMEGRHIEAAYQSIDRAAKQFGQYAQQQETVISQHQQLQGLATSTQLLGKLHSDWQNAMAQDAAAPTSDPHLADKFMDGVKSQLDGMDSAFSTPEAKRWWLERKSQITLHMQETTASGQASLAGIQALQNYDNVANQTVNNVRLNPASIDVSLGDVEASGKLAIAQLGSNATPETIDAVRRDIAEKKRNVTINAVQGLIGQSAPGNEQQAVELGLSWDASKQYLSPEEGDGLRRYAATVAEGRQRDQRQQQENAKRNDEQAAQTAMTQLYASGMGRGPGGSWLPPADMNAQLLTIAQQHPLGVKMEELHAFADYAEKARENAADGKLVTSSPTVYDGFLSRLSIPEGQAGSLSRAEIWRAAATGLLSDHDADVLSKGIDSAKDPAMRSLQEQLKRFTDAYKPDLGAAGTSATTQGLQRYYRMQTAVQDYVNTWMAQDPANHTAAEAQRQLLDPKSQYFLGKVYGVVNQQPISYPGSPATGARQTAPAGPPKRNPGESAEAFLARTGG